MQVSLFPTILSPHLPKNTRVDEALERIRTGSSKGRNLAIRNAVSATVANNFKKKLPCICFSGTFNYRKDDNLVQHSGLICLDFDKLTDDARNIQPLMQAKSYICQSPHVYACFLGPSGTGLKVLVRIPANAGDHATHFEALCAYFSELYPNIDKKCINVSRVCFESYDPGIYINKNAEEFHWCARDIWKTKHGLEERRYRAKLKIPKTLATVVAKDKKLMKLLAVYFALKPLYYSGVITNAKRRYVEIAAYLGIGESTLRMKLGMLKQTGLIWFDKNNHLHLASREKMVEYVKKHFSRVPNFSKVRNSNPDHEKPKIKINYKKNHEITNQYNTERLLRVLAIHESRLKQQKVIEDKIYLKEKFDSKCEKSMLKKVSPDETWDRYYIRQKRYLLVNKAMQREQKAMLANIDVLKEKYQKICNHQLCENMEIDGNLYFPDIDPVATLSCNGVARLFGLQAASAGHYWENILFNAEMLDISNRCIVVGKNSPILYKRVYNKHCGLFTRVSKKTGNKTEFSTLSNVLKPSVF